MPEINTILIEVKGASFSYGKGQAVSGITLAVRRGDYLGIIGPNGAGKTTLLKMMLGLLRPSEGTVELFGQDIRSFRQWQKIGYVPQKAGHFDEDLHATV